MAKQPTDDIDVSKIMQADEEAKLPPPLTYVTWYGCEYAHISNNRESAVCGVITPTADAMLVSGTPLGKPRCLQCLEALGIAPRDNEPQPFHGFEEEKLRKKAPPNPDLKLPSREPQEPTLPQEFFSAKRAPDDSIDVP